MTASKVIVRDRGWKRFRKRLLDLGDREVDVGVPETARYPNGTSVGLVAAVHEFGSEQHQGQAFMRRAFDRGRADMQRKATEVARKIAAGTMTRDQALLGMGEEMVKLIQAEITRLGLVDTGTLRDSFETRLRGKGEMKR